MKWYWAYVDCLKPVGISTPLHFGDLVHQALAAYYKPETNDRRMSEKPKRGPHPSKTFQKLYKAADKVYYIRTDDKWEGALELGIDMLENYIDHYGLDQRYYIVSPEMPFRVPIIKDKKAVATYVGVVDATYKDLSNGSAGFFEHKTAASINTHKLDLDEQNGTYSALGTTFLRKKGVIGPDMELDHVMYNFLRKGFRDAREKDDQGRYLNKDKTVSKVQPASLLVRHKAYREAAANDSVKARILDQHKEMQMVREGFLNPGKSIVDGCSGMNGCEFRDMCVLHESGQDWESYRDAMFTKWNPYLQHDLLEGKIKDGR